ncbi:hypothetical protein GOODEAATRI_030789, partial [Goodea atripinnis]
KSGLRGGAIVCSCAREIGFFSLPHMLCGSVIDGEPIPQMNRSTSSSAARYSVVGQLQQKIPSTPIFHLLSPLHTHISLDILLGRLKDFTYLHKQGVDLVWKVGNIPPT